MRLVARSVGATLVVFMLLVPVALGAEPQSPGRVIVSTGGDVTLPAGDRADLVVVINGRATILGEATTVVAIDGAATLAGARVETVVAVRSPIELGPGSVVQGDVLTLDSLVHRNGNAAVQGRVTDLAMALIGLGVIVAPALLLLWIGIALATIVAGLLLAGLAPRQVREAESLISREPVQTLAFGLIGLVVIPAAAFVLIASFVGAPLGIGILLEVLPVSAFAGYLVGAIWIGEWLQRRASPNRIRERPYLAAFLGILVLELLTLYSILAVVPMIVSLFGFGAVLRLALQKLGLHRLAQPTVPGSMPAPIST